MISGGRGARKKKFVENVVRKKKFVVEIDEKYVDQKIIFGRPSQKKKFSCGGKKKFATNKNSIYGAFLTPVTVFSVKAVLPWKLQLRLEIQVQCRLLIILYNIVI